MPPQASQPHLQTNISFIATHLHTALLAGAYLHSFEKLVQDPPAALLSTLPLLTLVQVVYVILCVDVTNGGGGGSGGGGVGKQKRGGGLKKSDAAGISSKIFPTTLSLLLSSTLGTALIYTLLILFGAPITTHFPHTILCAAHVALLAGFPVAYKNRLDGARWRDLVAVRSYRGVDEVFGGVVGAVVGAWGGAVPIPLDWDREWQKWPVTIISGAYGGYLVGKIAGGVFRGRNLPF